MSSDWKSPTTIIAIAGLLVSLLGNAIQFTTARSNARYAEQQLDQEREQWSVEQRRLEAEIAQLEDATIREGVTDDHRTSELDRAVADLQVWEAALIKSKAELLRLEGELQRYQATNEPEMAKATQKNIELQKLLISTQEAEAERARARRAELERAMGR
ncbi:hypothetical protein [Lysobacter sp. FW306-1B-D06B]|uniref:hypothetical protein n=1 Tax=Lysobacter sp. FW306-1B-D06B TaxID=3140250 RepID=UPI0031402981